MIPQRPRYPRRAMAPCDLQRVARELLARVEQQEGAQTFAPVDTLTRESGAIRRFGRPPSHTTKSRRHGLQ
jgi:hypothetical protein